MTAELETTTPHSDNSQSFAAAVAGLYIRPVEVGSDGEPNYSWQRFNDGQWGELRSGSVDDIAQAFAEWPANTILVVPAHSVVTNAVAVAENERRYFRKLAPFQLEEDIIDDIDELHFAFGKLQSDKVTIAYTHNEALSRWLAPFQSRELSIAHIFSEAALLPQSNAHDWVFYPTVDQLLYKISDQQFGTVHWSMAAPFLNSLLASQQSPSGIYITTVDAALFEQTVALLPQNVQSLAKHVQIAKPLPAAVPSFDLAVDKFYPRLPLQRWMKLIRVPLLLLGVGVLVHLAVTLAEWRTATEQTEQLKTAMVDRYREAVPQGAISDPLKQLRNQVNRLGSGSAGSNALLVLSQAVPVLTSVEGVEVKNLQYLNDARELRLTIQARALGDIESLSSKFKSKGFSAEVLSVNVNQGVHQARMKVTR